MSVRKRNEFLEDDESDGELDGGYDSDALEESRGAISGRSSKRRRVDGASDEESIDSLDENEDEDEDDGARQVTVNDDVTQPEASVDDEAGREDEDASTQRDEAHTKAPIPKQVAAAEKAARKMGVIYISRVPPFMKPQTLKHFLAPQAPKGIGRIFLTPEDHAQHTRRVKSGGNKKKSFTDGWVEFVSKREAKIATETLNGNIIGGKKGNFYHDDLWSMKYLRGFKWSHLTEQIANENAERAARMREEVRKTRRENRVFVEDVERGKMMENMEVKSKAKRERMGGEGGVEEVRRIMPKKEFKQKKVRRADEGSEMKQERISGVQRIIF